MSGDAFMLLVEDQHGDIRMRLEPPTPEQAAACEQAMPPLTEQERLYAVAHLARIVSDSEAYERECARRGLMPL